LQGRNFWVFWCLNTPEIIGITEASKLSTEPTVSRDGVSFLIEIAFTATPNDVRSFPEQASFQFAFESVQRQTVVAHGSWQTVPHCGLTGSKTSTGRPAIIAVKAKLHYASWFGAGSKLVRSQIPLRYLRRTSFEPVPNQLQNGSEPDSVMEFGREPASSC